MPERNECFLFSPTMFEQIALNLGVATVVTVLVAKAPVHLSSGVPLLWRGRLVISKDLVDDREKRSQDRSSPAPHLRDRIRFRVCQDLADRILRVFELTGDLFNRHPTAVRSANVAVILHRKHSFASVQVSVPCRNVHCTEGAYGGSFLDDQTARKGVIFRRSVPAGTTNLCLACS